MIDVDLTYDPASGLTLDEHREIELAKIEQSGFPPKAAEPAPAVEPAEEPSAEPVDEE